MSKGGGGSGRSGAGAKGSDMDRIRAYDIQAQSQAIEDDKKLLAKLNAELSSLDDNFAKGVKDIEDEYLKAIKDLKNEIKNNKS